MALLPHLHEVLRQDGVEVRAILHEPVLSWSVTSPKPLGVNLRDQVALALQRSLGNATAEIPLETSQEKKEACASLSDRTCVCGLAPRYDRHLNPVITRAKP